MSTPVRKYLIDSDVFMGIQHRSDFKEIYAGIRKLAQGGEIKTVRQVFTEMGPDSVLKEEIFPIKKVLLISKEEQYVSEVSERITLLHEEAPHLWGATGGSTKDPADPWLIAVAATYGYCLVTNEKQRSSRRIPAACKIIGTECECISGPHFLYKTKIVSTFDPAHIDPHAFFGG